MRMITGTMPREFAERRQPEKPLWAYLWPWLLMIPMLQFAAGNIFSFQSNASEVTASNGLTGGTSGAPKGQNAILVVAYTILGSLVLTRYRRVLRMALEMKAVTALACLVLISTLWSQLPRVTLVRATYYCSDTMFAYWLITRLTSSQIRTFIMMVGSVIAACSLLTILALPRYGIVGSVHVGAWQGIFSEKNHAGGVYLFLLTPVVDFSRRLGRKRAIYALTILFLLFMTQSRTAWIGAVLYPLVMLYLHLIKKVETRLALIASAVAAGVAAFVLTIVVPNLTTILLLLDRDPTLSGRTVVWGYLVESIAKRPLLGYGYYAFWTGLVGESGRVALALQWGFSYAHDGYLEILLATGIVGLSLVVYLLLRGLRDAWACFGKAASPDVEWYTGIILLTIIYNIDEESMCFSHNLESLLLLLSLCGLRLARREISSRAEVRRLNQASLAAREPVYSR